LLRTLSPVLTWSPGFRLSPAEFPSGLRGPEVPPLAAAIAGRYRVAELDAEVIGRDTDAPPQLVKYLWHILVLLGRPVC
jgi:hypothetical protein